MSRETSDGEKTRTVTELIQIAFDRVKEDEYIPDSTKSSFGKHQGEIQLRISHVFKEAMARINQPKLKNLLIKNYYFYESNFGSKDGIGESTVRDYLKYYQTKTQPNEEGAKTTLCVLAVYCGYFGWKGFLEERLTFEDGLIRFAKRDEAEVHIAENTQRPNPENIFVKLFNGSRTQYDFHFGENSVSTAIHPDWSARGIDSEIRIDKNSDTVSLNSGIDQLIDERRGQCLLVGDGGMGKTYSLASIWRKLLEAQDQQVIPIYIPLNRFNDADSSERKFFITDYIIRNYLEEPFIDSALQRHFWKQLHSQKEKGRLLLLLDGLNEVTQNPIELRRELDDWWFAKDAPCQVLITSRADIRESYRWSSMEKIELQPLSENAITSFIEESATAIPDEPELRRLLVNPLLLTLYCSSSAEFIKYRHSSRFDFKDNINSQGELLWNFFESQIAKQFDTNTYDDQRYLYLTFIIKHLLPSIGFEMERHGQYTLREEQLLDAIDAACECFYSEEFVNSFQKFRGHISTFNLGKKGFPENNERFVEIAGILCEQLQVLSCVNHTYSFVHQKIRDFSAALHCLNNLKVSNQKHRVSDTLREKILPQFILRFIGEVEGEHKLGTVADSQKNSGNKSGIAPQLEILRNKFERDQIGLAVWNIIEIYKLIRKELFDVDFSRLNLEGVDLSSVRCFKRIGSEVQTATFDGTLLHDSTFFTVDQKGEVCPIGHAGKVSSIAYDRNRNLLVTGGLDGKVIVWDTLTKQPLHTFSIHKLTVRFVDLLGRNERLGILSASREVCIEYTNSPTSVYTGGLPMNPTCFRVIGDGNHILFGFEKGITAKYYIPDQSLVREYSPQNLKSAIISVGFSSNYEAIYSCNQEGVILRYPIAKSRGEIIRNEQEGEKVIDATFSFCGKKIAILSLKDAEYEVAEFDLPSGRVLHKYPCTGSPSRIKYNTESDRFAVIERNRVLEYACGNSVVVTEYNNDKVICDFDYHPNGLTICAGDQVGQIIEWSTKSSMETYRFNKKVGIRPKPGDINITTRRFLTSSNNNRIYEWSFDPLSFQNVFDLPTFDFESTPVYSPDGRKFLIPDRYRKNLLEVSVLDGAITQLENVSESRIGAFCYLSSHVRVALDFDHILIWDSNESNSCRSIRAETSIVLPKFMIPTGDGTNAIVIDETEIFEMNLLTGKSILKFKGIAGIKHLIHVFIDDESNTLLGIKKNEYGIKEDVYKWNLETGELALKEPLHKYNFHTLSYRKGFYSAFYPDHSRLDFNGISNPIPTTPSHIHYVEGVFVRGCKLDNLHYQSQISELGREILDQYGAEIGGTNLKLVR